MTKKEDKFPVLDEDISNAMIAEFMEKNK